MTKVLSVSDVKELIKEAEGVFHHEDCKTCECYLGYIVQLQIDSDPEASAYLENYRLTPDEIHSCLGCDPCPPGILYTNYLRKKISKSE